MAVPLLEHWTALLGDSSVVVAAGRALLARYAEPHRRYHDQQHLEEMLSALDLLSPGPPPVAVVLAAYWHDAVYDPHAPDNEARSAELAQSSLAALGVDDGLRLEVRRLVLLTAGHDPLPDDSGGALLCDADLAVLAATPDRYRSYASAVRQEYAHVGDADFRAGRSAVLRELLNRPYLFRTPTGRERWEQAARRNVGAELVQLSAPSGDAARRP